MTEFHHTGKVLVLGSDFKNYRSCLTIVRSLGRKSLKVHIGWNSTGDIVRRSKYVARVHDIPDYSPDNDLWKTKLIELVEKEQFDLVVPCNEQASAPLEAHRKDLTKYPSIYILSQEAYEIAFDKFKSGQLAKSLGINLPKEIKATDLSQIDEIMDGFQFPIVLKPHVSFHLESLERKNYVYKAYNAKELKTSLRYMLKSGDVQVQENFIGTGVGAAFLADSGELLCAFCHVRIHEPLMGGGSSYRKSAPLHPELRDAVKKLLKAMNYTGVGMVEFKFNFDTGEWIFLEINGRFWGSLPLAVAAGADFPYFLYRLKTEKKKEFPKTYKTNLFSRNTIRDFNWIIQNACADKTDPSRNTLPNSQAAKEIFNVLTLRERNDTFVIDDLKPGFVELWRLIINMKDKNKQAFERYSPIRFLRTFLARRALRQAKMALVVCFGNIYRSPFAEKYIQSTLSDSKDVYSAGYLPKSGRRCHQRAIDIADEFEIDMKEHRSKVITEEAVHKADIILTFDKENRRILTAKFPGTGGKIYYLGLLSRTGPVIIDDPVDGNLYTVRETYRTIKKAIDSFVNSG